MSLRATRVTEHGQVSRGSGVLHIDESRSVETGTGRFFPRLSGVTNDFDVDRWTRETGARRWTIARGTIDRLKSRALEVRSTCALVVARSVETIGGRAVEKIKIGARVDRRTCERDRRRATPRARMGVDARLRRRLHRRRRARRRRRVDDSDEASFASDDDARTPTRTRTRRGRMTTDAAR